MVMVAVAAASSQVVGIDEALPAISVSGRTDDLSFFFFAC
jgi:hypothetical protein